MYLTIGLGLQRMGFFDKLVYS